MIVIIATVSTMPPATRQSTRKVRLGEGVEVEQDALAALGPFRPSSTHCAGRGGAGVIRYVSAGTCYGRLFEQLHLAVAQMFFPPVVPPPDPIHLRGCGAFGSSFVEFQPCAGKPSACLCWASGRGPVSWSALLETLVPVACLCWASGRGLSLRRILVLVPNACLCWASGRGPHLMLSCCLLRPEME